MNKPEQRSVGGAHGAIPARRDTSALPSTFDGSKLRRERHVYSIATISTHLQAPLGAAWRHETVPKVDGSGLQPLHAAPMELGGGPRPFGYNHAGPTGPVANVGKNVSKQHCDLSHSETLRGRRGLRTSARSWSAVALYRFRGHVGLSKSAAGAAHSKTWRNIAGAFCLTQILGDQFELEYRISPDRQAVRRARATSKSKKT